jgi:DNA-binding transcriptional regulator YiaG/predicted RNA-binding Zn-ribbon protein involved in translation (DUF1610 family)
MSPQSSTDMLPSKVILMCPACGKSFICRRYRIRNAAERAICCSHSCGLRYHPRKTLEERFWAKVDRNGPIIRPELGPCWLWTGSPDKKGYGRIWGRNDGANIPAHRLSYALAYGAIVPGLLVCHSCDNPPCVNPEHLFLGTPKQNTQDAYHKGRLATGAQHGAHTHPERMRHISGGRCTNGTAKLTDHDVRQIRASLLSGVSQAQIARRYGVSKYLIYNLAHGKTYRYVT